jgi:hypothetical protein
MSNSAIEVVIFIVLGMKGVSNYFELLGHVIL